MSFVNQFVVDFRKIELLDEKSDYLAGFLERMLVSLKSRTFVVKLSSLKRWGLAALCVQSAGS